MKIIFSLIGLFIGGSVDEFTGAFFGFFIGLLAGWMIQQRNRILELENKFSVLQSSLTSTTTVTKSTPIAEKEFSEATTEIKPAAPVTTAPPAVAPAPVAAASVKTEAGWEDEEEVTLLPPEPGFGDATGEHPIQQPDTQGDPVSNFIKKFFTTGNVVVKVGAIIVLFGVSFLLKLAAEHHVFPVEFWFIVTAAFAIGLLVFGWRLRHRKPQYALIIQGLAIGILYITVFVATLERFSLLPLGLAFVVMLALVIFSGVLAVLQNSMALAVFATTGGFLAPILTSSGSGNHVALFTYYAFLNAGIFGIAWYKSWRLLNWLGFVFTFVIASLWGYRSYQPEHFNTTEPFLILFFLFYVAIAILYAHRQPPQLKGLVDGSLVFGTPLVGFTLQAQLVEDFAYGESFSALAIGAMYIVLARILWNKQVEGMRLLTESFLALGIIFGSLAIPFALDGRWTAAAWALEGAGIAWIGIRQQRLITRLFGILLQIGAPIAFISDLGHPHANIAILNSAYVGSVLISLSALFTGLQIYRHGNRLHAGERDAHYVFLIWGLIWWFAAGLMEIDYHVPPQYESNMALLFIAASFWLNFISAKALRWKAAIHPPLLLLPVIILFAFVKFVDTPHVNPFHNLGYLAWITAFLVQYALLYRAEGHWNRTLLANWHILTMWTYLFMATWIIANAVSRYIEGMRNWYELFWGLLPAIAIYKLLYMRDKIKWPLQTYRDAYLGPGIIPIATYLAVWIVVICFHKGDPNPLPYYPILNPQDIALMFSMLALWDWLMHWKRNLIPGVQSLNPDYLMVILAAMGFLWLNSVVAHAVHFYYGVPFDLVSILQSDIFQTIISIVWTLTAFILMGLATARSIRKLWFVGVVLLAAVVVKLFMIDLDDSGTVTRIVSFLTVGILMLVIGYFSPLPPKSVHSE